jgi:rare lipoprotein A (peptidoglycan hydrolase)
MPDHQDRCARKNDLTVTPGLGRTAATRLASPATRLRWGVALVVVLIAGLASIPAAQAETGGAAPTPTPVATTEAPLAEAGSEIAFGGFRFAGASWYGPGLWGRKTACGETLRPTTIGVAHKTLPCGTTVKFVYHGRAVTAPVIDRGPYVKGRSFDLTAAAAEALDFEGVGVGTVRFALPIEYAAKGLR